jgi:hypothetical protein
MSSGTPPPPGCGCARPPEPQAGAPARPGPLRTNRACVWAGQAAPRERPSRQPRRRAVDQLRPNPLGEVLEPGRVADCYLACCCRQDPLANRGRHHPDHRPGRVAASSSSPARRGRSTQREVEATRARERALRRLALELPDDYQAACQRRLQASPPGTRAGKARRRAVGKGLSDLADQHGERYEDLYQQELEGARSEPGPIRRGRPPGSRDQLAIRSASFARTWPHQPGRPRPRPRPRMGPALSPRVRLSRARGGAVRRRPLGFLSC